MFVLHSIAAKAAKRTTNEAQKRPLSYKYRVKKEQPLLSFIKRGNCESQINTGSSLPKAQCGNAISSQSYAKRGRKAAFNQ